MAKKKNKKTKKERKVERELLWILGFMVFLVIVFLVSSSIFKTLNQVEYEGLIFTKENFGQLPVFHYYYYFRAPTGNLIKYNLFLRNDPTLNDIPIEGDEIHFIGRLAYMTLDTAYLRDCEDTLISIGALTKFMSDNQFTVRSGNMDFVEAAVHNQEHITCEIKPENTVIQIRRGNETKITINGPCNDITIGPDCRILEAVEKFEVHSFLDAQK